MQPVNVQDLMTAGVHFGHLRKKWNPKMKPYIFMERKGIHIIDLNKTADKLKEAAAAMKSIAKSGRKVMFVATKKQAKEVVSEMARAVNMPYVTERWLGGMMTNFSTIRKSVKKMQSIEKMLSESNEAITKKERLVLTREKNKMEKVLNGVAMLNRLPAAIFIVDVEHEHIAVTEAKKLNITTFAMVDTNADPNDIDFPIPANDDATKSIEIITRYLSAAVAEGLEERKRDKDAAPADEPAEGTEEASESEAETAEGIKRSKSGRRVMRPRGGVMHERTGRETKETASE